MEELLSPPEEKKLPAPEEKLLCPPTFSEKYWKFRWLVLCIALILIFIPVSLSLNKISTSPQSPQPITPTQPLPTPTTDPTANWKTYKEMIGGEDFYTFKYPTEWTFNSSNSEPYIPGHILFEATGGIRGEIFILTGDQYCGIPCINITADKFFDKKEKRWSIGDIGGGGPGTTVEKVYETAIAGKRAMTVISRPTKSYEGRTPDKITITNNVYMGHGVYLSNIPKDKLPDVSIMVINFFYDKNSPLKEKEIEKFNQILSTLKFSGQARGQIIPLSTVWQTGTVIFTNPKLGISFEYPKVFEVTNAGCSISPCNGTKVTFSLDIDSPDIRQDILTEERSCDWCDAYQENTAQIQIIQYDNSSNQTLDAFIAKQNTLLGNDSKEIPYLTSTLKERLVASSIPVAGSYMLFIDDYPVYSKRYYFMNKDNIYSIRLDAVHNLGGRYSKDAEKVFDRIVSSVKFTQ